MLEANPNRRHRYLDSDLWVVEDSLIADEKTEEMKQRMKNRRVHTKKKLKKTMMAIQMIEEKPKQPTVNYRTYVPINLTVVVHVESPQSFGVTGSTASSR